MGSNYSTAFGPYPLVAQAPGALCVLGSPYLSCPHHLHLVVQVRAATASGRALCKGCVKCKNCVQSHASDRNAWG